MRYAAIALATMVLLGPVGSSAQGSASTGQALPDSNMAPPSGNTGEANNGIGHQGSLTQDAGSHSSNVTGAAAAAQLAISPKPAAKSNSDPEVEKDPAQGGGKQH